LGGVLAIVAVVVVLATRGDDPSRVVGTPTPAATATATATTVATRVQTIEKVGDRPSAIERIGDELLVAGNQPWLTRIDAGTGREAGDHPKVGDDIAAMAAFEGQLWVALGADREVVRLDPRSGRIRTRVRVPDRPGRLAVDRRGLWVATQRQSGDGQLLHYDLAGHLIQTITVNEGIGALVSGGDAIWLVKERTNKLAKLKPGATALTDWAALPAPAASLLYAGGALWIALEGDDAIARVDARTGNMRTVAAGHSPAQSALAGGYLFVASRNDNTVVVIDPKRLKPVGEPIDVGFNPYALAADERSVWVTGLGDNTLTRIDYR
jgi:YVTN family beta-propeller protein